MSTPTAIYLDNHATTRCDPRVVEAMLPFFTEEYGNAASRSHGFGYRAKRAVEDARASIARHLGCSPKEVLFTSGATESNNLAILGCVRAHGASGSHVVTVATEHKAVLDPVHQLEREGASVTVLTVGEDGLVSAEQVAGAIRSDTVLVSVMAVNNEIGVQHPLEAIGEVCRERGVAFHCDAAQAAYRPIDVRAASIDLLSLSAHKIYGPKGIGALFVRRGRPRLSLEPLMHGGGHERGLRSGTLPVPSIIGLGRAVSLLGDPAERERVTALRDTLLAALASLPGVTVNGSMDHRAPNNLNVSFSGIEAEALLLALKGVAVSTGSACTSATIEPSHVLRALGLSDDRAHGALRFGLGRFTTAEEITDVSRRIVEKVDMLRALNADTL